MDVAFHLQRQFRLEDYFRDHGATLKFQFGSLSLTRLLGLKTLIDVIGTSGGMSSA